MVPRAAEVVALRGLQGASCPPAALLSLCMFAVLHCGPRPSPCFGFVDGGGWRRMPKGSKLMSLISSVLVMIQMNQDPAMWGAQLPVGGGHTRTPKLTPPKRLGTLGEEGQGCGGASPSLPIYPKVQPLSAD